MFGGGPKDRIRARLDDGETIVMHTTQSRVRPGGAAIITPNTIYLTEKRIIIRNPTRLGIGENIEEYYYRQITNVRLEKGLLSSSLVFAIPGMTEISKADRKTLTWGRDAEGTIDAISKGIAEEMYAYIRKRINQSKDDKSSGDDPLDIIKRRFATGEITEEQYRAKGS